MPPIRRPYRLGLDLGSNSIGWFVVWLDAKGNPKDLGPGGVRIFPDGRDAKSKESNAVARRLARGMRRRRDRYVRRRAELMQALVDAGLMPAEEAGRKVLEGLDPYALRVAALAAPLPLHHLGRAIFHLDQRRGFQSNRKTEKKGGEDGVIKQAAGRLAEAMAATKTKTLGQFLAERHARREPVRVRNQGSGTKTEYDFYPTRDLVKEEFEALWQAQAPHHPELTDAAKATLHRIIFFQRPLKSPPAGKCTLSPARNKDDLEGFRAPRAHPLAQQFRIWQEVRNLRIDVSGEPSRPLTPEEGDLIGKALLAANSLSFDKMRALLKLSPAAHFNLESEKRDRLKGDETAEKLSAKKVFGKDWRHFPLEKQCAIVDRLLNEEDEPRLIDWLMSEAKVPEQAALAAAGTLLPDGHSRLGLRALKAIVPLMAGGLSYTDACIEGLGVPHSPRPTGEQWPRLPYYGQWLENDVVGTGEPTDPPEKRFGRLPNPTVHIGLGQLRRVVNILIERFGPPDEVVVEMTRSFKLSPMELARMEKEQAAFQRKNDARRERLHELGHPANHRNLMKLRLWEELSPRDALERECPFTGERISVPRLLSDEVEIEHLIPFRVSFDDSAANKTVALREANRHKGKRTPFHAFGASPTIAGRHYDWAAVAARAASLPKNKRWRFGPDALERFGDLDGFQARQLNETGWLARMAKDYMGAVTDPNRVWVIPGRLTAMIRAKWGLNDILPDHNFSDAKNRLDHRHHALDALVACLTDRRLLQAMASAYDDERDRIEVPVPIDGLRDKLIAWRDRMTVSVKADHGVGGRLHDETAYGLVKDKAAADGRNLVYRKAFGTLTENELGEIRDRRLRDRVAAHWAEAKMLGIKLPEALASFVRDAKDPQWANGIRHVRLLKPIDPAYLVQVRDGDGTPYKAYAAGENAFVDILETPEGKWIGQAATVFQANDDTWTPAWLSDATLRFVMRVFKGDMLRLERDGGVEIMVVRQLEASNNRMKLAGHNEAGSLQDRHNSVDDPFRWLMASYNRLRALQAVRVRVDPVGTVWTVDPVEDAVRIKGAIRKREQAR
ncbi:type II CRISPR RNA-guided endonuclease Cas9 [Zavarzinia compransoris]|uniref:type II CRISPR RNA-guided endonuclease Cas9 n=1 Tax=Zavarzinia marina TaxID=2911065 RepID=UPI001EEACF2B|nr:type II CRISPR RNA-guided endonuclease Cas9 [Zavarzinia marina]MCF4164674.1 type II CRISPR RNA-guided endonuclease Cas9 [Zavarzinia marina]